MEPLQGLGPLHNKARRLGMSLKLVHIHYETLQARIVSVVVALGYAKDEQCSITGIEQRQDDQEEGGALNFVACKRPQTACSGFCRCG